MDDKLIGSLLSRRKEEDWLEFKQELKLYKADDKVAPEARDEFLKDIIGLANGNSHIVRKTKYLIVGAGDSEFDLHGCRLLRSMDYRRPAQGEIVQWLSQACSPGIPGLECDAVSFHDSQLFIITIPPTFELHETTRPLKGSGKFNEHTVFIRQDEHTMIASTQERETLKHLKRLYSREIANPPAIWIGAVAGAISTFIISGAFIRAPQAALSIPPVLAQILFTGLGIFFGGGTGYFATQWNENRYAWRYMTNRQRLLLVLAAVTVLIVLYVLFGRSRLFQ